MFFIQTINYEILIRNPENGPQLFFPPKISHLDHPRNVRRKTYSLSLPRRPFVSLFSASTLYSRSSFKVSRYKFRFSTIVFTSSGITSSKNCRSLLAVVGDFP